MYLTSHELVTNQKEKVMVLLQVEAETAEAKRLEKEYLNVIQHALLETEGDPSTRLDGTLKELNGLLKGLLLSKSIDDVHAILAIVSSDGTLHVSHAGRAEGYIVRGGAASQITEYTRGKPTPAFVHIASGTLEPRDAVVFGTQRLLRALTPAQLAQLVSHGDQLLDEVAASLDSEREHAALGSIRVGGSSAKPTLALPSRGGRGKKRRALPSVDLLSMFSVVTGGLKTAGKGFGGSKWMGTLRVLPGSLLSDLKNPKRRKRAHLLLLAGAVAIFLVIWAFVNLTSFSQRTQSRAELQTLVEQINEEIRTAENRFLTGDIDSANAVLLRAEDHAKQVMDHDSGLFRIEALDLLDRIRSKREEINNIVRLSPRVVVNLASKSPDVEAQGLVGVVDGEFVAYDRQDLYRVVLNTIDEPDRLSEEELIMDGTYFERMQTLLFQLMDNSVMEIIGGQPTSMKTDDPAGWIAGSDIKTYLRFLYILSPQNNQIYRYERLSNRYGAPTEYNVNGELTGALDMAIDGNVYVLKEGGELVKLFRGEVRPFVVRHLPENAMANATKIFKILDGNLYILDPVDARVIVVTDGGATGESSYLRQYVFEGEQIGELKDLYVDPDQHNLYVLDEKRVYSIDLNAPSS